MDNDAEFRERLVRIETKFEGLEDDFSELKIKMTEIHTAFVGAKGAKWALMASLTIVGAVLGFIPQLLGLFNKG
jgi:hypothetical protein